MEMQLQTKDTLATLHLDPRTKLYLLIDLYFMDYLL